MKRLKLIDYFLLVFVGTVLVLTLVYVDDVKEAVISSVKSCVFTVIPSLFVVCVLAGATVDYSLIEKCFAKSRINPSVITAFILGNIGGYPVGAKTLKQLVESGRISRNEADKAICFSFASGPAFCLGIVSSLVFRSSILGLISFLSVLLANTVIFVFMAGNFTCKGRILYTDNPSFTDLLVRSVTSSAYAMMSIGSAIAFFSAMNAIIVKTMPMLGSIKAFPAFMEISAVAKLEYTGLLTFVIITAILAFGGVCVHLQVKSLVDGAFSLKLFYLTRPVQIILSALFSSILFMATERFIPASAQRHTFIVSQSESILPFICMIFMIVISVTYKKRCTA